MPPIELLTTDDGSSSLFNSELNETYHSKHGAIAESNHVFIQEGLKYYINKHHPQVVAIFEVGFGTGLNALLTLIAARNYPTIQFYYESIDTLPMPADVLQAINYTALLNEDTTLFMQMHQAAFEVPARLSPNFMFNKVVNSIHNYTPAQTFNIVYFDAFAPEKQPDMWQPAVFNKLFAVMGPNAIMVTYCAQGQFRRDLKAEGFTIEKVPGPPPKREMTRVTKPLA